MNLYKDILSVSIDEKCIEQFYALFKKYENIYILDNGVELRFIPSEKSEIIIKGYCISIDLNKFSTMRDLFEHYLCSDRKFPMDISLEQLGFSIQPIEIKDIVLECG